MARNKHEFRPDTFREDILGKILLTKKQSQRLLRWVLFCTVCLTGLILQDVVMSRFTIFGTTTDLVPCCILAICILQGAESGCIFALCASLIYYFSGSAPGIFAIPMLTCIAVLTAIFRQAYLRKGFSTLLLCTAGALLVYEIGTFLIGLFLGSTIGSRFPAFLITALITLAFVPLLYPILLSIGKIGGETWKE
ncbi:MAG: hypothetical protein IJW14_04025 [Oscillospiraceae bacterium]|nr:hypothetical protein [Oscillospiraceae bacterium]